jgi:hypothetical protein
MKTRMRQIPTRHRTGRFSGKKASAYRAASSRPLPRHPQVTGRRTAVAAGRRRKRRPLLFYALVVSVAGELAAIAISMQALVLLFSLTALFLCAMVFRAAKA